MVESWRFGLYCFRFAVLIHSLFVFLLLGFLFVSLGCFWWCFFIFIFLVFFTLSFEDLGFLPFCWGFCFVLGCICSTIVVGLVCCCLGHLLCEICAALCALPDLGDYGPLNH